MIVDCCSNAVHLFGCTIFFLPPQKPLLTTLKSSCAPDLHRLRDFIFSCRWTYESYKYVIHFSFVVRRVASVRFIWPWGMCECATFHTLYVSLVVRKGVKRCAKITDNNHLIIIFLSFSIRLQLPNINSLFFFFCNYNRKTVAKCVFVYLLSADLQIHWAKAHTHALSNVSLFSITILYDIIGGRTNTPHTHTHTKRFRATEVVESLNKLPNRLFVHNNRWKTIATRRTNCSVKLCVRNPANEYQQCKMV